jgi:rhodanese-related sulfurtransferase
VTSITPRELKQRLERGDALTLLDVRERGEHAICALPGDLLIPMDELPSRLHELDPDAETVVYCHHGIRSSHVIGHLQSHGFTKLVNLRGGIEAWARDVDPTMKRY